LVDDIKPDTYGLLRQASGFFVSGLAPVSRIGINTRTQSLMLGTALNAVMDGP